MVLGTGYWVLRLRHLFSLPEHQNTRIPEHLKIKTMIKYIYTSIFLLFFFTAESQNLIEKFRSESGERWFNRSELLTRSKGAMTNDFNGNGFPEAIYRDSLWFAFIEFTPQAVEYKFEVPEALQGNNTGGFWGPYDIDGQGLAEIILRMGQDVYILSLDEQSMTATTSLVINLSLGFFDVDGDQLVDILQYDPNTRQTIVLGVPNTNEFTGSTTDSPEEKSGSNYQLTLKFESEEGSVFPYLSNALQEASDWDLNGDGVIDLVLVRTDTLDTPLGFRVFNGISKEDRFTFILPEALRSPELDLLGFFDVDGENGKEIYLSNGTVIDRNQNLNQLPQEYEVLGFVDIDNDGLKDIIGRDTVESTIQVWGVATSTPVDEVLLKKMGVHLDPAYPNPMSDITNIPFQLQESMHVQLQILSVDGRLMETVVDDVLPSGAHLIEWNANDLNPGMYLYRFITVRGTITQALVKQ
jgi:hypothetical protein